MPSTGLISAIAMRMPKMPMPTWRGTGLARADSPTVINTAPAIASSTPTIEPATQRALRQCDVVAHRRDGRDPGCTAGGEVGREHRHEDARRRTPPRPCGPEHQRAAGEVEPEVGEQRPEPGREPEAEHEPEVEPISPTTAASISTDRVTCAARRAEGAQQRELAAALRDEDRERVDDEEGADDQRDAGEDQQERVEEAEHRVDDRLDLVRRPASP